jgi:hypothetical protein
MYLCCLSLSLSIYIYIYIYISPAPSFHLKYLLLAAVSLLTSGFVHAHVSAAYCHVLGLCDY